MIRNRPECTAERKKKSTARGIERPLDASRPNLRLSFAEDAVDQFLQLSAAVSLTEPFLAGIGKVKTVALFQKESPALHPLSGKITGNMPIHFHAQTSKKVMTAQDGNGNPGEYVSGPALERPTEHVPDALP